MARFTSKDGELYRLIPAHKRAEDEVPREFLYEHDAFEFLAGLAEDELDRLRIRGFAAGAVPVVVLPAIGELELLHLLAGELVTGRLRAVYAGEGGRSRYGGGRPSEPGDDDDDDDDDNPPVGLIVNPLVEIQQQVVIVKRDYTTPARRPVQLKTDSSFDGTGTFTRSSNIIKFFTAATGGDEITFNGTDNSFEGGALTSGVTVYAEGASASSGLDDVTLTLTLSGGSKERGPAATGTMTSVEVTLEICQSRTAPATDPTPLSAADKINKGRFVQVQVTDNHCGRAKLIVKKAVPEAFAGELEITAINNKVQLFAGEIPGAGQSATALPHAIANSAIPADGSVFWVQGAAVSGALRDTGFKLGVKDLDPEGDKVVCTAVAFKNLRADIPSTSANTARASSTGGANNFPVPRHTLTIANGGATSQDLDEDFTSNVPLVLVEDSILDADKINLSVEIEPAAANTEVKWSVQRDTRAAIGDHADIIALDGNSDDPGLVQDAGDKLKATLTANAVGSFHIRPYIDCNGNSDFDHNDDTGTRIDREPYILMNLTLIRVQGHTNTSRANSAAGAAGIVNAGGRPSSVTTGDFNGTGNDAAEMTATARVIGGGADGKRGLDQLFCGWLHNEVDCPTSPSPIGAGEDVTHHHRRPQPPPRPLRRLRCFWQLNGNEIHGPVLDSGYTNQGTGGDSCTGTAGRNNPQPTPAQKVDDPSGIGQRWESKNVDSPGGGVSATFPGEAAATIRRFTFNIDFQAALVFWTNRNKVPGAADFPACRLYSSVQTDNWNIRLESTFDDAFTETVVVAKTVTYNKDANATRRATPIAGSGYETRQPDGLTVLQADQPF